MIASGFDVNCWDESNFRLTSAESAIETAAGAGLVQMMDLLISAGARVTTYSLSAAASGGHADAVRLLLESGADATARDRFGATALERVNISSTCPNKQEIISILKAHGATAS
jgi:ankyrin repeat protein